ncbi:MAG: response regulator [Anaerolineae bacterium]
MTGHTDARRETSEIRLGHQETLLVIEDNPEVRATVVESLTQLNYRVLEARQGKDALGLYERHRDNIALVVSDWIMPEMGGRDLVQALRERGLDKPILILSGHPPDPQAGDLNEAGIVWLQKPLTLERLARGVVEALGH